MGPTQVDASPPSSTGACLPLTAGALAQLLSPFPEDKKDELLGAGGPAHKAPGQSTGASIAPGGVPGGRLLLGASSTALAVPVRVPGFAELFEDEKVFAFSREE